MLPLNNSDFNASTHWDLLSLEANSFTCWNTKAGMACLEGSTCANGSGNCPLGKDRMQLQPPSNTQCHEVGFSKSCRSTIQILQSDIASEFFDTMPPEAPLLTANNDCFLHVVQTLLEAWSPFTILGKGNQRSCHLVYTIKPTMLLPPLAKAVQSKQHWEIHH